MTLLHCKGGGSQASVAAGAIREAAGIRTGDDGIRQESRTGSRPWSPATLIITAPEEERGEARGLGVCHSLK